QAQGDPPELHRRARGRAGARAGRRARAAVTAVHRGGPAQRVRAADRPGAAGGLARGAVPRHPDHAVRPADGGQGPARADAPRAPARDDAPGPAGGTAAAPRLRSVPVKTFYYERGRARVTVSRTAAVPARRRPPRTPRPR